MNTSTNSAALTVIPNGHVGMCIANYLNMARKGMTMKELATKIGHSDTGLIYRRLKQAEPDFGFMIEIMEAFDTIDLIQYVPEYAKEMLTHHAKVKHPEWFEKKYASTENSIMASEPNENYEKVAGSTIERLLNENQWLRKLNETQKELIEMLKMQIATTNGGN